ncbi:MAG: alpha-amylase family glycosyl hydrolase [Agathobacter sp.]|nr:alpha-amylase family glycosyl hydrolase [Agathobacter sp.]
MNFEIKEGNYTQMGVVQCGDHVVFTFEGEKEDTCFIVLIDKVTEAKYKIKVPKEYCLGSLRSVLVMKIKICNFYYYYEINGEKVIDPYATVISGREKWNDTSRKDKDYEIVCGCESHGRKFDWKIDTAPEISKEDLIMYKLHVRGFTMDSNVNGAGTFQGIRNKLNYLESLGINAIELMPVYEFEEMLVPPKPKETEFTKITWEPEEEDLIKPEIEPEEKIKINFWGYGRGNYFAVKSSYAKEPLKASYEFKKLVRTLHERNIECIMEIYFEDDTNHNLIRDVLRYWVREYHVDGFHILGNNVPMTAILQDVMLSRTKIFYTAMDGNSRMQNEYKTLYIYKEEYMYPSRKILNHMNGEMRQFLNQQKKQGDELGYVNFITSNNGFTLADIFMYNDRHNEDNGEDNLDGNPWNFSNNYGIEGPTRKRFVKEIRALKWRNAVAMLYLAQGVPLLWSGDEFLNSQSGNNNAYCQDNAIGWVNWKVEKSHRKEEDFLRNMIKFRKEHPVISNAKPYKFCDYKAIGMPDVSYHGENAWIGESELDRMCIGVMYSGEYNDNSDNNDYVYIGYNFFSARNKLALPKIEKKKWYLVADTTDAKEPFKEEMILLEDQMHVDIDPQAICILVGR